MLLFFLPAILKSEVVDEKKEMKDEMLMPKVRCSDSLLEGKCNAMVLYGPLHSGQDSLCSLAIASSWQPLFAYKHG